MIANEHDLQAAEVIEVIYNDSNPNLLYGLKVKLFELTPGRDPESSTIYVAKPLNANLLRVPIVGEVVLCLPAPSAYASGIRKSIDYYYIDIISLQNSVHHNALPTATAFKTTAATASGNSESYIQSAAGITNVEQSPEIDSNFKENVNVKPLQNYVGDVLLTGRYGQSLRFSSTQNTSNFTVSPRWKGTANSDPITILSTTRQKQYTGKFNDFKSENFNDDDCTIVMSTGQELEFKQSSTQTPAIDIAGIKSWKTENWGQTPQILITSGRLVFNSTQQEIIAFAKNGIGLSSATNIALDAKNLIVLESKKINIGNNSTEPLVLGNQLVTVLKNILKILDTIDAVTKAPGASKASIALVRSSLDLMLSQTSFTKR